MRSFWTVRVVGLPAVCEITSSYPLHALDTASLRDLNRLAREPLDSAALGADEDRHSGSHRNRVGYSWRAIKSPCIVDCWRRNARAVPPVSGCRGSASHGVVNRSKKADIVERLVDMPCETSRLYAPMVRAAGEARNGDDGLMRVPFQIAQRVKELESVHAGHLEIADDQIDVLGLHRLQRLDSVPRRHDIGAKPFERQASRLARVFYVFDHENAEAIQPLQATRPRTDRSWPLRCGFFNERKPNRHLCAMARSLAGDRHRAPRGPPPAF